MPAMRWRRASGGARGLQEAYLVTLPLVLVAGIIVLFAIPTYATDVAAALESARMQERIEERKEKQEKPEAEGEAASPHATA